MAEFLFEIGLEEIPARMIAGVQAELERRVVSLLQRERLIAAGAAHRGFSTPRRLAVWVSDVAERQDDVSEELLGPSAKIAFKDGVATPAAVAFAKKAGVAVEALTTVTTPKGEYLQATSIKAGRAAAEVIARELPKELAGIYWAKNMSWRAGKPEKFVRPVRWLLALLGGSVVPVEFAGCAASNVTFGHRVLCGPQGIVLRTPASYEEALKAAFVIVDVEARRHTIRKALDHATRTVTGIRWREDHALVDSLTHLVEWASDRSVVLGDFEPEYLALPEEVLVTVMRDHQRYFALEDQSGRLAPHFLAVLNTQADAAGLAVIRHGNGRVLRARFNDARFFWEFDQRTPLVERVKLLENVTFQKDLGSYAAKSERVRKLCDALAAIVGARGFAVDQPALRDAAALAKTDLTAELVKEFTELQGEIGSLYARAQGLSQATADAIYDQYRPVSMEARIARTPEGQLLAIADKADTIAGMFRLGLEPTGSKDPFALRRAANGIVKTLAESDVPLLLSEIASASGAPENVRGFFVERLDFYLREVRSQAYDVVKAVLAVGSDNVRDAVARAEAVTAVRSSADFAAVSAAFKRMTNILAQAREKGLLDAGLERSAQLNLHPAQSALVVATDKVSEAFTGYVAERNYVAALELIATLRPQVDHFFEEVMVMDDDLSVRQVRLKLLAGIVQTFSVIADFSEIVMVG